MLLDSWVWIEFFKDGPRSLSIRDLIHGRDLFTSVLSMAEISFWLSRNGVTNPRDYLEQIRRNSTILFIDEAVAEHAGAALPSLRKQVQGIGLVDALIYAQAQSSRMQLLSGDAHFKGLDDVQFIE